METRTEQQHVATVPVRTLRVDVVEGPDAGKSSVASEDTLTIGTAEGNDLVLGDRTVSRYHAELANRADGVLVVDHGSTNGTWSGHVRIDRGVVAARSRLRLGRTTVRVSDGDDVAIEALGAEALGELRGRAPVMRRLMARIERAGRSDSSVLVVGESGTGKELIARALSAVSVRAAGPFVTVDCGALSPTLVASELFGHERGAFTGADRQHIGCFERAQGGTVFLDEVGELPASLQATLLGVLERRAFRRLGGRAEIALDVRVVSATNRDLRADVNVGTFRLDLFYRLAVVTLAVPPLRERPEDIPLLVEHFLRACGYDGCVETLISPAAMSALSTHRWPGNVRELRNLIEATVAMGEPPEVRGDQVTTDDSGSGGDPRPDLLELSYKEARGALLQGFEARYLRRLLERAGDNVTRAARIARMDRSHLIDLLHRHGIR